MLFRKIIIVLLVCSGLAIAQERTSKLIAAEKLASVLINQETFEILYTNVLNEMIKKDESAMIYKDIYSDFFRKHATIDTLKSIFKELYCETFEESELNELVKFFASEVGRKITKKTLAISMRVSDKMKEIAVANMPELEKKIAERNKDLDLEESNITEYKNITAKDSSCSILIPTAWIEDKERKETGVQAAYNSKLKTAAVSIIKSSKDEYESAEDTYDPEEATDPVDNQPVTLKDIASNMIDELNISQKNVTVISNEEVKTNGIEGIKIQMTAEINSMKFYFYVGLFESNDNFFQLNCVTQVDYKDKYQQVFDKIYCSFVLTKKSK